MTDPIKDTVSQMPEVNPAAVETEAAKAAQSQTQTDQPVDTSGNIFDTALHETNADGSPRLSPRGKLLKKRGRVAGKAYADSKPGNRPQSTIGDMKAGPNVGAEETGKALADLTIAAGVILGGTDWIPPGWKPSIGQDETALMAHAYAKIADKYGMSEIPPEMELIVAVGGYAIPRLWKPSTAQRWSYVKAWSKHKYRTMRYGKAKAEQMLKDEYGASTDSGSNAERKDNGSKATGEKLSS